MDREVDDRRQEPGRVQEADFHAGERLGCRAESLHENVQVAGGVPRDAWGPEPADRGRQRGAGKVDGEQGRVGLRDLVVALRAAELVVALRDAD